MWITRILMVNMLLLTIGNWIVVGMNIDTKLSLMTFLILGAVVEGVTEIKIMINSEKDL